MDVLLCKVKLFLLKTELNEIEDRMGKDQLIDMVSEKADLSKDQAGRALDAFMTSVINAVANGDKVTISGFGSFEGRYHKARKGTNPRTGEVINIPAATIPAFSPSKSFKDIVKDKF